MPDLNKLQIEQLRDQMMAASKMLEQQLVLNENASKPVELDQSAIGRVSRVDAIQQQNMAASARRQAQQRLARLNTAIKAIENDDYGYCQDCDEPINFKRLQVKPEATLCLACQQQSDINA